MAIIVFFLLLVGLPGPLFAAAIERITPAVQVVREYAPAVVHVRGKGGGPERAPRTKALAPGQTSDQSSGLSSDQSSGQTSEPIENIMGSGVIVNAEQGLVITCASFMHGAQSAEIRLMDGRIFDAEILRINLDLDVAVLRIEGASALPEVVLAASRFLLPGEAVIALGNPYGFGPVVASGILASRDRGVFARGRTFANLLQTDAGLSADHAGGALLNTAGDLLGMNVFIDTLKGGFAVSADSLRRELDALSNSVESTAWLGFAGSSLDWQAARNMDMENAGGVRVGKVLFAAQDVTINAPPAGTQNVEKDITKDAAKARGTSMSFQEGDMLLDVGNVPVTGAGELASVLSNHSPGERIPVSLFRDGLEMNFIVQMLDFDLKAALDFAKEVWGITLRENTDGIEVLAVRAGSSAAKAMVQAGDRLTKINGMALRGGDDLKYACWQSVLREQVLVEGTRQGERTVFLLDVVE